MINTMKPISSKEIRETFQKFFEENDHLRIKSASIVPKNDPTLLFINSGMAPLKQYFTGEAIPPQKNLCNSQPCIRTIDIDDVGDRHHLTFFEMLGSWSINGYFKETAIKLAYDLLVNHFKFDPKRLVASVYKGNPDLKLEPDHESAKIWKSLGFDDDHIVYQDHADNFWGPAGETGPCGPCTEVFFDTGDEFGPKYKSGEHFDDTCRYIEIWNAGVFMEFNKEKDGSFTNLKFKSVDTGSGLERMCMVLNNHQTVYETDLLKPLIDENQKQIPSITTEQNRILADHCRAFTLMLAEGVRPSNEGRGYIPRRLIRKCLVIIHQHRAEFNFDTIFTLIQNSLGEAYPLLIEKDTEIRTQFHTEAKEFGRVLTDGMERLEALCQGENWTLSGTDMFTMVSTYGFPPDLIREYVKSRQGQIDEDAYQKAFEAHQAISKASKESDNKPSLNLKAIDELLTGTPATQFTGYTAHKNSSRILAILKNESKVTNANEGDTIQFITESTCFYGEGGGQIGDTGTGQTDTASLTIIDTQKTDSGIFIHSATINSGNINIDQKINLKIDSNRRNDLEKNHSATHLLQHALRQVLGTDVKQAGSLVEPNKLRFDFNCDQKPSTKDLQEIEVIVNTMIQEKLPQETVECGMEDALKQGAIAFFEDKYGDQVRVVKLGPKSIELCGGTHVANTGDIHYFKIISEGSVGKGTRRIVALTSTHAHNYFTEQSQTIQTLNNQFNTHTHELISTLSNQFPKKIKLTTIETNTQLNDELSTFLKEDQVLTYLSKSLNTPVDELSKRLQKLSEDAKKQTQKAQHLDKNTINQHTITNTNGLSITTYHIDTNFPGLRDEACRIAEQTQGAVCLSTNTGEKVQVVVAISKSHTSSLNANTVLQSICQHIDGRGGGKDHLAMGAGSNQAGISSLQEEFKAKLS